MLKTVVSLYFGIKYLTCSHKEQMNLLNWQSGVQSFLSFLYRWQFGDWKSWNRDSTKAWRCDTWFIRTRKQRRLLWSKELWNQSSSTQKYSLSIKSLLTTWSFSRTDPSHSPFMHVKRKVKWTLHSLKWVQRWVKCWRRGFVGLKIELNATMHWEKIRQNIVHVDKNFVFTRV